jgi:tetratricopeptide (TPR) repeat protein
LRRRKGNRVAISFTPNALQLGRYGESLAGFGSATELDPTKPEGWYNKGEALRRQDKYTEAIEQFDRAIEIDPAYSKAWNSKGLALKALGRDVEAEEAFAETAAREG